MCIGVPMQVIEGHDFHAICADGEQRQRVDTTLVGRTQPGSWLLVFLGAAREVLDAETALLMRDAVAALGQVMAGNHQVEHLFADLVDREPELPAHLREQ